jgi:hypothetical protein
MSELTSNMKEDIRIARLVAEDAKSRTDHLAVFRDLVLQRDEIYPGIEWWLDKKVIPGLATSERTAYVGYVDEMPIMSAVVKRGTEAKLCHLRIGEDFQDEHIGEAVFSLMVMEVRNLATEIHFTLPERLWKAKRSFFDSFGFSAAFPALHQYRLFEDELMCSSDFSSVWKRVLQKLPKIAGLFSVGG